MKLSVLVVYFLFGVFEIFILYRKQKKREIYLYIPILALAIVIGILAYKSIIPRQFARVVEFLVKPFKY